MTWPDLAVRLADHPTELALGLSLVLSLMLTAGIRFTELLGRLLKRWLERNPGFLRGRGVAAFARVEGALVMLVLALAGVFGGGVLFLHIVETLRESPLLSECDRLFVETVHHTVDKAEVAFFSTITPLAGVFAPIIWGVLVTAWLVRRKERLLVWIWISGLVGNSLIIVGLKQTFQRQRPVFEAPLLVESNFSFPSGHAMTSILLYGLLGYVVSRMLPRYSPVHRHVLAWVVTFLGFLIGTSRLVLGVHFPSDVMAGWSVGATWLSLLVLLSEFLRGRFRAPSSMLAAEPDLDSSSTA